MDRIENLANAYSQSPWRKQVQVIVAFLLALVVVAIIAGIYLNVSARAVTLGHEILSLQDDITDMQRTIADLRTDLAYMTSTTVMQERADDLGLEPVRPDQILYVVVPGYGGRQEAVLAPPPGPVVVEISHVSPAYTESLIDWLKENVFSSIKLEMEVRP